MKKPKIAWITDTTASLDEAFIQSHDVFVVPMYVSFGHDTFQETYGITAPDFYERLKKEKRLPTTSQPAIGEVAELYERVKNDYDHVIAIHASGQLTGTYQSSMAAAHMTGVDAFVLDSGIGSYPLGEMVRSGVEMAENGSSYESIIAHLNTLPHLAELYLIPASLEQLHKGGRLSGSQTLLANLMNVKVILKFDQGKAVLAGKVRTEKKGRKAIVDAFQSQSHLVSHASILHADVQDQAEEWKRSLEQAFPHVTFSLTMLSPVPGTHTGYGTLGLAWLRQKEKTP